MSTPISSSSQLDEYLLRRSEASRAYSRLSFSEAVAATQPAFTLAIVALMLWALMAVLIAYTAREDFQQIQASFGFSSAHAGGVHKTPPAPQPRPPAASRPAPPADQATPVAFKPPFGIPLGLYYFFITALFLAWLAWFGTSFYRGYLAATKEERAAAHVEHQVFFLFGTFIGGLIGHSIA